MILTYALWHSSSTNFIIYHTIHRWLEREGMSHSVNESHLVESCVAAHYHRIGKTFYYKADGEIDVIHLKKEAVEAIEIKWTEQIRHTDLKLLKHFKNSTILTKNPVSGMIDHIRSVPAYTLLYNIDAE